MSSRPSSQVTSPLPITGTADIAIRAPALTSCTIGLEVAHDTASSSFVPISGLTSMSAAFAWPLATGSAAMVVSPLVAGFSYLRLKSSVPQAADRLFRLHTRG